MANENLIDFPCSPAWAGYYAERGMTQDFPDSYYYPSEQWNELDDRIMSLEKASHTDELNMLRGEVAYLHYKLNEHLEKSRKARRPAQGIEL